MVQPPGPCVATPIRRRGLGWLALAALAAGQARAETFPSRPIRIVIPFAPGGEPDIIGRRLAASMEKSLGQPVVVDNRPGANTVIAATHVAGARADGYTVMLTSSSTFASLPHLYRNARVTLDQFAPLTLLMRAQMALYCHPDLPVRNVAELVAYAKAQPRPIHYAANPGAIAHLCGERMMQRTGIRMIDVAYRGTVGAQQLMMRGDVPVGFDGVPAYIEIVRDGKLRALGVTGQRRVPAMPQVPTFEEAGFPDIALPYWYGAFAPAGTPRPIIDQLTAAMHEAQRNGAFGDQILAQGAQLEGNTPEQFTAMIVAERESWGELIRGIGLQLD